MKLVIFTIFYFAALIPFGFCQGTGLSESPTTPIDMSSTMSDSSSDLQSTTPIDMSTSMTSEASSDASSSSASNTTTTTTTPIPFTCASEGYFALPSNPHYYFYCQLIAPNTYFRYDFECPGTEIFNGSRCVSQTPSTTPSPLSFYNIFSFVHLF